MDTNSTNSARKMAIKTGYAPANGINMYYEIHGGGRPLVLVHGGGSTIETSFSTILPLLAEDYMVIAAELQGHGHTSDRDAQESFEQDADDVIALCRYLSIEKASFLGFSNGGNTCMRIAMRQPGIVDRLVIISSLYKREGMREGFFEGMKQATLQDMPQLLKDNYLKINNDERGLVSMFTKDRDRMIRFEDWSDEELSSIAAPTFFICGDHDVVTSEHTVQMSRLVPNSQLMIVPGNHGSFIGEICNVEEGSRIPGLTVEMIKEFLNQPNRSKK
jgi:pimeloyl-ACP methyl ester carboxylesterase